jgi:RTX calcium-binding nonapeptide repeat (4 copies)
VRRALASLALVVALLLVTAGSATTESRIAIRGGDPGTHLRLSTDGAHLFVTGPLAGLSDNCQLTRGYGAATCSLEGVGGIEVTTGPADDKVEVLNRLPVPLTAYLGDGSDKLVGSGEPDTCYPQGTPRNRCVGEGGNDTCISGPVNTDCVGGSGDDYCKTGSGSDGCWGGPGSDTCLMGDGQDGCHGEGGNDRLYGGPGGDQLYGGDGADLCDLEPEGGRSHECELRTHRRNRQPALPR